MECLGKRLYDHITRELCPHAPCRLETGVCEDLPSAMRFVQERGFVETMREHESQLDLTTFEPAHFAPDLDRLAAQGIALRLLTGLADQSDRDARLQALEIQHAEAGSSDMKPPEALAEWQARFWNNPRLLPGGFCVAIDQGTFVGQSNALTSGVPGELEYGFTGVLPAYRNRGIARAMKVRVLSWAKSHGYTLARSWTSSENAVMILVNLALGFVPQPAVVWFEKLLERDKHHHFLKGQ
jgi:mycothiol synthase